MIRLTRLLSDGCILRMRHAIHIWGWTDVPGELTAKIVNPEDQTELRTGKTLVAPETEESRNTPTIDLIADLNIHEGAGNAAQAVQAPAQDVSDDALLRFDIELEPTEAGGPYELRVRDARGEESRVANVMVGAVFFISGQSNIDVTMERCYDSYPEEVRSCTDPALRIFCIDVNADYHGPVRDVLSGSWKSAELNNILSFTAAGYFFARALKDMEDIPVGIIQASLGGSRITSWMSREMLEGDAAYQPLLSEMDRYADDGFMQEVLERNETAPAAWHMALDENDAGLFGHWEISFPEKAQSITVPCCFHDTELNGFIGTIWITKTFEVPGEMAGKSAGLWLGTMVDADTTWVNGVRVGETEYQYPPRKYRIPERVLRSGINRVTIRLTIENGEGRITPGKGYFLYNDQGVIDLAGEWQYAIGAKAEEKIPATDFVNWKAGGLYNGMAAPCTAYPVNGIVWYQGEANTHEPYDYLDLTKRYVEGYRKLYREEVPYLYVQLPNCDVDVDNDWQWPALREKQRQAMEIPSSGMAVTMDLGEDNDLHPHGKKEIGRRLAFIAEYLVFHKEGEYTGPVPERAMQQQDGTVAVELTHAAGLYADACDKGSIVKDMEVVGASGRIYPARVELMGNALRIYPEGMTELPVEVRYACHNIMYGALIYNGAQLPMTPFVLRVQ